MGSATLLLGAIVLLVILAIQVNSLSYRQGLWYRRRLDGVRSWGKVTLKGSGTKTVTVKTTDGTFRVAPVHGLIDRTEIVPIRTLGRMPLTISYDGKTTIMDDVLPMQAQVASISAKVELVERERMWNILNDMEVTSLGDGGLLHSDCMTAGVNVLLIPGKSSPFMDKKCLDKFRNRNIRLHVVYYEDHTFACREGHIECGFKSGNVDLSLSLIKKALRVSGATLCVGYSLGGLLLTTLLKRRPNLPIDAIVLINPFLCMSMHSVASGLDTHAGLTLLRVCQSLFPKLQGETIIPRSKSRFDWVEFMAYRYPISIRNPQRDDPARYVSQCSFKMIESSIAAMLEIRAGEKIKVPVLLIGGTQDEICSAKKNMRVARRAFEDVRTMTFSITHAALPSTDEDHDADVIKEIAEFFHSVSHDVVVDL